MVFSDVVVAIAVTVGGTRLALTFTDSRMMRLEMLPLFAIGVVWVLWAIDRMLERSRPH